MKRLAIVGLVVVLALIACEPAPGAGPSPVANTRLRMSTGPRTITATVFGSGDDAYTDVQPQMWMEAQNSAFEVQVSRRAYDQPKTARAFLGKAWRNLPLSLLDDWDGFRDAFTLTWRDPSGASLGTTRQWFCPNNVPRKRIDPKSPKVSRYAVVCGTHPFSKGQRWGIEGGWAVQALGTSVTPPDLTPGQRYTLDVHLSNAVGAYLGIPVAQRDVRFTVNAVKGRDADLARMHTQPSDPTAGPTGLVSTSSRSRANQPPEPRGPNAKSVNRSDLPDLVALPPIGIGIHPEGGRDLLDFSATVWNSGPAPIVVDGYRRGNTLNMSGHQLFVRNGVAIGTLPVNDLKYNPDQSHLHWHLLDFAYYDLVNTAGRQVAKTPNKGFCLAPTDPIDLLQAGAVADPGDMNLATACGDRSSTYVREVLAPGWGDTYTQVRSGQSIDITNLPNGTYRLRVTANPAKALYELRTDNNVALRTIIITGEKGKRRVKAPPYQLIDSEAKFGPLPQE